MGFRPQLLPWSTVLVALVGCVPRHRSGIEADRVPLGKVVVYRNGVAYYERRAQVHGGKLTVRVPRERVDDFLKSLTVVDARTQRPLPVSFPRHQADDAPVIDMQLDVGGLTGATADVVMTYVTDAAAWKPSYRLVLDGDTTMLEGWAIVDNLSGEDWKDVVVGVGSSSAMSFRYDLWSVRTVERAQLEADEQFAVAPPTAVSPYGGTSIDAGGGQHLLVLDADEIRDVSNVPRTGIVPGIVPQDGGKGGGGATALEGTYVVDGVNTTGVASGRGGSASSGVSRTTGAVRGMIVDKASKEPVIGATVMITGPALQGQQADITDEDGSYRIGDLPPGTYVVTVFHANAQFSRPNVLIQIGKQAFVKIPIDTSVDTSETIELEGRAPVIDQGSMTIGTVDADAMRSLTVHGRAYQGGSGGGSSGRAEPSPPPNPYRGVLIGDDKLSKIVPQLVKSRQFVVVEGYAAPGEAQPEARSLDRANVVRNQLIDAGVSPGRVRAVGKGAGAGRASVQLLTERGPASDPAAAARGPRAAAVTDDQPVGESHFDSGTPMTVGDGTSAMVSVLRATTSGREVYLYDGDGERGNARFAFKSVRVINPTDSTLEAGPVTVYGAGRYIGEGLTEPIGPNQAVVVPYALDRQIVVEREAETGDELSQLVTVQRGILTAEVQHVRTTKLTITSRLRSPSTVYVRHAIEPGWELLEQPLPTERIGEALLVEVAMAPGETRTITLREATPMTRQLELGATSTLDLLQLYVKSARPTPKLREQLTSILGVHRELFDTVERIAGLRDHLVEYRARATELEQQIVSLRKVKTAVALSRELTQKAAEMSTRIQRATVELVEAQERVMLLRVQFQDALAELRLPDAAPSGTLIDP